ncbi:MAG: AraC family transcriptional regulator [Lachnospiraceae bacterium]|nr:AraC family transcriptional regulator [Lachnospiraceae bacterium]
MINVSGHFRNERRSIGFEDHSASLSVNCCGMQIFKTKDYTQNRAAGRVDYQLIYIHKGAGHYYLHKKWENLSAGNILLFRPHEPQTYSYYFEEHPEIYWIHFTGNECKEIIQKYNLHNCYIGEHSLLKTLFQEIIIELQIKKPYFEEMVLSNFLQILATIARSHQQILSPLENDFSINRLVIQLNQKYMDDWNIESMAEYCKLSTGYFSHLFKKRMGSAPMKYLTELRIEKAKELIATNSMNLSDIAQMVGFTDPLYFSRVFKKTTGIPPKEFQQSLLTSNTPDWWAD